MDQPHKVALKDFSSTPKHSACRCCECEYEDVCASVCVHQREMSKRNRFIKVMTKMSFYFRKLPSNAPLQERPLLSIWPFHLKPSVSFSTSVLRESTWTPRTSEQGNTFLPHLPLFFHLRSCLTFSFQFVCILSTTLILIGYSSEMVNQWRYEA